LTLYDNRFGSGHICGGTLVSEYPNIVVTAAHCMYEDLDDFGNFKLRAAKEFKVVTGNVNKTVNDKNTITRYVKKLIVHENYKHYQGFKDDIAILIVRIHFILIFDTNCYLLSVESIDSQLLVSECETGEACNDIFISWDDL
jgi:secreted trypsin-like serine protease